MEGNYLFTSESVSEGHPDKVCDIVSDTVLDLCLSKDPQARVACETMTTTNRTVLAGELRVPESCMASNGKELSSDFKHEIESAVRQAVKNIGYEQDGTPVENIAGPYYYNTIMTALDFSYSDGGTTYRADMIETDQEAYKKLMLFTKEQITITSSTFGDSLQKYDILCDGVQRI